jgi:uncharacterized Zn finger protein
MCKHVAAVLYGVGARLDSAPELLFSLRDVDHLELIGQAVDSDNIDRAFKGKPDSALAGSDLGEIFGIDLEQGENSPPKATPQVPAAKSPVPRPRAAKKPVVARATIKKTVPLSASRKAKSEKSRPAKKSTRNGKKAHVSARK